MFLRSLSQSSSFPYFDFGFSDLVCLRALSVAKKLLSREDQRDIELRIEQRIKEKRVD